MSRPHRTTTKRKTYEEDDEGSEYELGNATQSEGEDEVEIDELENDEESDREMSVSGEMDEDVLGKHRSVSQSTFRLLFLAIGQWHTHVHVSFARNVRGVQRMSC